MNRDAVFSKDGRYRYRLTRHWGTGNKVLCFVMLNPSTANAEQDDPTVRLCISWATRLGFDGLVIVNLFGYQATDPRELKRAANSGVDVVGSENTDFVLYSALNADMVICAWGNHGENGGDAAKTALKRTGKTLYCLKTTKTGQPVHPLYQPYSLRPVVMS